MEKGVQGVTEEDYRPHLKKEAARVLELYQADVVREIYFREDRPTAVLVLECGSVEAVSEVLSTLPLVKAGLITFDIIPLAPYPGFYRLFFEET